MTYTLNYLLKHVFPYDIEKGEVIDCNGITFKCLGEGEWALYKASTLIDIASLRVMSHKQRVAGKDKTHEWYLCLEKYLYKQKNK